MIHDADDDNVTAIRLLARDDYDTYDERLDFARAAERRGYDAEIARAVEELGEDECAEIYEDAFDDLGHADNTDD